MNIKLCFSLSIQLVVKIKINFSFHKSVHVLLSVNEFINIGPGRNHKEIAPHDD